MTTKPTKPLSGELSVPEPSRDPACAKCGGAGHRTETIRTTGDDWSRYFNLQNQRFRARICERCGYTELYSLKSDWGDNVWDLLIGS